MNLRRLFSTFPKQFLYLGLTLILVDFSPNLWGQRSQYTRKLTEATRLGLSPSKAISQYRCDIWKKPDGLPQNSVFSILQSSQGYLWLATYEGLAQFDGRDFTVYNTSNVEELKTSGIWTLYEDSKKNIWLGMNSGGLVRFSEGKFKVFSKEDGLAANSITCILEDDENRLWIGTHEGLCLYENGKFQVFTSKDGLNSRDISSLFLTKDKKLLIGTSRGVTEYKEGKFQNFLRNRALLIDQTITSIGEDAKGYLWFGTQTGLLRFAKETSRQESKLFRVSDGLSDEYITKVFCDSRGSLWIGTQGGGINRIIQQDLGLKKPRFDSFGVKEGLSSNSVLDIYEDREGSLWLGLSRGGLNRLWDGKFTNYTRLEGLSDNVVNCIYQSRKGTVWVGTMNGGLSCFKYGRFIKTYNKEYGLSSNYIRSIAEDRQGNIWIATYGGGVNQLLLSENSENPPLRKFTRAKDGLTGDITRSILCTQSNGIWIGTNTGLSHYQDGSFTNYTQREGLSDNSIISLHEDQLGNIWIGTEEGGLNCLKLDGTIETYPSSKGLANDLVFCIYEDEMGTLWVGTKGGLSRIREGEILNVFAKDGLANDDIHSIREDTQGRMWFSSNNGVFWIDKTQLNQYLEAKADSKVKSQKLECTLYQEEDGMKSSDCAAATQPSVLKDEFDQLWYPTSEGISIIDPEQIKLNYQVPPVTIQGIIADNIRYRAGEEIKLKAGLSKFEIDFAALSFLAPSKVQYRYRLKGDRYSEPWVESGNKRDAYYTNLPPGNYVFEVQATNNDGVWNRDGAQLKFYLAPFFYQTWWFYALLLILFVSLGFGVYYWRIRSLEKSKEILEQKVLDRTQEVQAQYKEINQQAQELETIDNIVKIINQELKFDKVLQTLTVQGLRLFAAFQKSIFLVRDPKQEYFNVATQIGYSEELLKHHVFSETQIQEYCEFGLNLDEDVYQVQAKIHRKPLDQSYRPSSSLVLLIRVEGQVEGLIAFDQDKFDTVAEADIPKIRRFREHAVSAFEKAKILRELELTNHQVESSFKKISDSIRYARRIQKAILPSNDELDGYCEDQFIFYRPKDIVSGDFYWVAESVPEPIFALESTIEGRTSVFKGFNDSKTIITAVDCTGHGVPGAFMTVIGTDLLNAIVFEDKIVRAHLILDKLDRNIKTYLKQEGGGQSRDGMDMALIVVDEIRQCIEFAGAKNPLYQIREGELTQFKGSKYPIGGDQIKQKEFTSQVIHYQEGDVFYMFSDGFIDQFGGDNDRKYGSKRFRELMLSLHHLPMAQQKERLVQELENWQGKQKQTDDILVMGLRF